MKFFDLLPFQSSKLKIPKKKRIFEKSALDLNNPTQKTEKLTDIAGQNSHKKAWRYMAVRLGHRWKMVHSSLFRFGIFALVIALLFNIVSAVSTALVMQKNIKASAYLAIQDLQEALSASKNGDLALASGLFGAGKMDLASIKNLSTELLSAASGMESDESLLAQARNLLETADFLAEATEKTLDSAQRTLALTKEILIPEGESISDGLMREFAIWKEILDLLEKSQNNLAKVDFNLLPENLATQLKIVQNQLAQNLPLAQNLLAQFPDLLDFLGHNYPRRYLILLQNKNEIRPTGGFIGSLVLVEFNDARLTKMEVKDVYDYDGQLTSTVKPPTWFGRITNTWGLRDANYSPDFPTSAKQATVFFEQGGGVTVNGVIAINQSLVENLLKITGPIEVESLPTALDQNNFSMLLSLFVEAKISGVENPKQPLMEFVPIFEEKLLEVAPEHFGELADLAFEARKTRQIMAWSEENSAEKFFEKLGIDGKQYEPNPSEDYLQIVRTNIAGNKSDFFVNDAISHMTSVADDGTLEDTLTIKRTHNWQNIWEIIWENLLSGKSTDKLLAMVGKPEADDYANGIYNRQRLENSLYEILGRGANIDFTRIYLPKGSELLEVTGVENDAVREFEDLNKKVIALEITTLPKEGHTVTIKYRLPFKLNAWGLDNYYFYFQKQAGTAAQSLEKGVEVSANHLILTSFPESVEGQKVLLKQTVDGDSVFGAVID